MTGAGALVAQVEIVRTIIEKIPHIYRGWAQRSPGKGFLDYLYNLLLYLRFEYVNPMAGLAMFIIGLFLIVFGYFEYGITPVVVGLVLVAYYRKYLWQILGISQL
jgi:hypothetical protein